MSEKEGRLRLTEDGHIYREGQEESKCSSCEKKSEPCVSFFAHENSMMHKDMDNERAHRTTLFVCLTFLLIVIIFVVSYTVRTSIWLETIKELNAEIIKLACAKGIVAP